MIKTYYCKKKLNKKKEIELKKVFNSILDDINNGNEYVNNLINTNSINIQFNSKKELNVNYDKNTTYLSSDNIDYINENGKKYISYTCKILNKLIKIHFMLFTSEDELELDKYDKYVNRMLIWLYICNQYSQQKCNFKDLNIYIYLTPLKKVFPDKKNKILDKDNINSAYTYPCNINGEIHIFREEEWMKVFIHECCHCYGFDAVLHNATSMTEQIKEIFPIKMMSSLCDTYVETIARIMNAALFAYNALKEKKDYDTFYIYINFLIQIERLYSLNQVNNILSFMDLEYKNLYENTEESKYLRDNLYREKSHVFDYFILTSVLLNNYKDFCLWCVNNDINFYRFNPLESNCQSFIELIKKNYSSRLMINELKLIEKYKNSKLNVYKSIFKNKLRMSIIEL